MDANVQSNDWLQQELKPKLSYLGQFGILIGLIAVAAMVVAVMQFGILVSMGVTLKDLMSGNEDKMMAIMAKPENFVKATMLQALSTLMLMAVPAFILARMVTKNVFEHLGFNIKINYKQILLTIAIAVFAIILSLSFTEANKYIPYPHSWRLKAEKMEETYLKSVLVFANIKTIADYFLSILMIAILPAIFEELLFRATLQKLLVDWTKKPHIAILIASILFSLVHISIYGFLARMFLGMVLGYLFYYGKSIWLNILMHFINNALGVTSIYLAMKNGGNGKSSMDESLPIWVLPIAGIITVALLMYYKKVSEKENITINQFDNSII